MRPYDDDSGLAGSALIYAAAIGGGLLLFVAPVYLANRPTVYPSSGVERFDQILPAPNRGYFPLARLEHQPIVDPAVVTALNENARADRNERASATQTRRPAERQQPPRYAESAPQPRRDPFSLFFSLF
jgi:hypothetical protein